MILNCLTAVRAGKSHGSLTRKLTNIINMIQTLSVSSNSPADKEVECSWEPQMSEQPFPSYCSEDPTFQSLLNIQRMVRFHENRRSQFFNKAESFRA